MNKFFVFILLFIQIVSIGLVVVSSQAGYFRPYYNDAMYAQVENLYNNSQYRLKNPTSIIADEIVFRYAAGAYLRGVDPILINSEHTPLGKYFIGLSFILFQTDKPLILLSAISTLVGMWFISSAIFGKSPLSLIAGALYSIEPLFRNQLIVTPLLDIIQLPFVLFSIYFFFKEQSGKYFMKTAIFLGLVMATKSIVPAILLGCSFLLFLCIQKRFRSIKYLLFSIPLSLGVFTLTYVRTFISGYSFWDFVGFQKWIFLYQQSRLILPLSFWRLMMLNQWQAWWGDWSIHQAIDWWPTWPILVLIPFILVLWSRESHVHPMARILLLWIFIYEVFLSLGAVVTRFLLPLLPAMYIVAVYYVVKLIRPEKSVNA